MPAAYAFLAAFLDCAADSGAELCCPLVLPLLVGASPFCALGEAAPPPLLPLLLLTPRCPSFRPSTTGCVPLRHRSSAHSHRSQQLQTCRPAACDPCTMSGWGARSGPEVFQHALQVCNACWKIHQPDLRYRPAIKYGTA